MNKIRGGSHTKNIHGIIHALFTYTLWLFAYVNNVMNNAVNSFVHDMCFVMTHGFMTPSVFHDTPFFMTLCSVFVMTNPVHMGGVGM